MKPKINKVYFNKYDGKLAIKELNNYDDIMSKYNSKKGSSDKEILFSKSIINSYESSSWVNEWNELIKKYYT